MQFGGNAIVDFCNAFADYVHSQGLVLAGSINYGSFSWFVSDLDIVGGEAPGAEGYDVAYTRRAMSYGKPWTNLLETYGVIPDQASILAYMRQGLLLGFFPGFDGYYWDSSSSYERDRDLFKLYMPLIKTVALAGWMPVPYATPSDANILIERFGDPADGTFYISAQNSDDTAHTVTITLDGAGLGISTSTPVTVTELVSNSARTVTRNDPNVVIPDTLAPGETLLYQVNAGPSGTAPPFAKFSWNPTTPFAGRAVQFADGSTNLPTAWYWDFADPASGDANLSTAQNPVHVFSAPGNYSIYFRSTNAYGNGYAGKTVVVWTPTPRDTPEEADGVPSTTRTIARKTAAPLP
jgi:PKD repeat protein